MLISNIIVSIMKTSMLQKVISSILCDAFLKDRVLYTMRIVHPDRYHLLKSTDWHYVRSFKQRGSVRWYDSGYVVGAHAGSQSVNFTQNEVRD